MSRAWQDVQNGVWNARQQLFFENFNGVDPIEFPGDHGGFLAFPEQFGRVLDQVLSQPG